MDTKLTLKLRKSVIDQAKKYASNHDTSLSRIVENYLAAITADSDEKDGISPLVKSISGIIQLPDNFDHKADFHKHLDEMYI